MSPPHEAGLRIAGSEPDARSTNRTRTAAQNGAHAASTEFTSSDGAGYARGGGGSGMVGALKKQVASGAGAVEIPCGEPTRASASSTANGPSIEASVARPLLDVLRQVQAGFVCEAGLWCIGHSAASLWLQVHSSAGAVKDTQIEIGAAARAHVWQTNHAPNTAARCRRMPRIMVSLA